MTRNAITVLMVELDKTDGEGAQSLQQRFLLFGLSVPMLISAMLYNPVFLQMEEKILEN